MDTYGLRGWFKNQKGPVKGFIVDLETQGELPELIVYRDNLNSYAEEDRHLALLWVENMLKYLRNEHGILCTFSIRPYSNKPEEVAF